MSNEVPLIAAANFKYRRQRLAPGDPFTAPRAAARAFVAIKRARPVGPINEGLAAVSDLHDAPGEPDAVTVPVDATYETKHLEAESPAEPITTDDLASPRTRRAYKRRDVQSKG